MPSLRVALIVLVIATGLILLVWGAVAALRKITRIVTRSFWCPLRERWVTVEFQEEPSSGRRVGVTQCTACSSSTGIYCEKLCLRLDALPTAASQEERPS